MSLVSWICGAMVLAVGCERAPQAVTELPALSPPLALADSDGGDYNWPVGTSGFIVAKPPPFAFLRNASEIPEDERRSAPTVDMGPIDEEVLDDLLGGVGTALPHPFAQNADFKMLMEVELQESGAISYCLSPKGDRLLVCGEQIRVYDTGNGQQLSSQSAPAARLQACVWPLGDHFYVADASRIYQADANTGTVVKTVGTLAGTLAMWQPALHAEIVFGCYENGRVFRFDQQSTQLTELGIKASGANKQIAVKPDGTGVIVSSTDELATYRLEDDRIVSEEINSVPRFGETVSLCWSPGGRHWSNGTKIFSYPSGIDAEQDSELTVTTDLLWRPIAMHATGRGKPGNGWTSALVMRNNMAGKPTLSVCEVLPDRMIHSVPTALPVGEDTTIAFSLTAKVLAFVNSPKLQVVQRRVWEHCGLARMRGGGWLQAGEFEKLEQFGRYLLATEEFRWGYSPHELYGAFVGALANEWLRIKYAIDSEQDAEQKRKLRAEFDAARVWAETSVLGQLVLAQLRLNMAWDARQGKAFPANSPSGWELYEQQNKLAGKELDILLADADAPAIAYALRVGVATRRGESHATLEPVLKRGVARYANNIHLNQAMVYLLMPQWSGAYGDSAAYLKAVLKRGDPALADSSYARVAVSVLGTYQDPETMYHYQKYEDARVVRGALAYLDQDPTDRVNLMYMLVTATFAQDLPAQQQLARYYQSHFMFVDTEVAETYRNYVSAVYNDLP
ncbi:YncE family protein [Roseimaritima ulvae]|uniref:YncE family protein n=1 Tax=Roseimaritima ulvae TaxID=980254 RepID=UPI0008303AEF|nr:WD40 repeat domain-containing protein [Roseimaritima ulvae]